MISLDALGLEKVYVQAKRWQSTVGRTDLQAFYGALAGQKSKRGVFITTSDFTAQAVDFSRSVEGVVLVDGKRLVKPDARPRGRHQLAALQGPQARQRLL